MKKIGILTSGGDSPGMNATIPYLTDSLTGILKNDFDLEKIKTESMREKYGLID